jgi:hypothetical protein
MLPVLISLLTMRAGTSQFALAGIPFAPFTDVTLIQAQKVIRHARACSEGVRVFI